MKSDRSVPDGIVTNVKKSALHEHGSSYSNYTEFEKHAQYAQRHLITDFRITVHARKASQLFELAKKRIIDERRSPGIAETSQSKRLLQI